jgi:uncharacterized protein
MTPQENQALQEFLNQLVQVSGIAKDPQAEALIARAVAQQPDATYLLVQRAMLLEQALNQSKAQITQLQNELQSAREPGKTDFLDSATAWGHSAGSAARPAVPPPLATSAPVPAYPAANPAYPAAGAPYAAARPGFFGGNAGSFLTSMAATAAGVAGGAFLFHGIESLLSHPAQGTGIPGSGLTSELTSGLTDAPPVENAASDQFDAGELSALDADSDGLGNLDAGADSAADDGSSVI